MEQVNIVPGFCMKLGAESEGGLGCREAMGEGGNDSIRSEKS